MIIILFVISIVGCTTTGHFKIPKGSDLYIYERPTPYQLDEDPSASTDEELVGTITTKPFFWTAMGFPPGGGIPYKLKKGDELIKKGRLRAKFRVLSIFWPPFAVIYWPVGFNKRITYDLINDVQE